MGQVGGHAVGLEVVGVKVAQLVVGHAARVKRTTTELRQGDHGVARRATTGAPGVVGLQLAQQLGAARRVDQGHVPLVHAHGAQLLVRNFVFGVHQRVADGVKVVMAHGGRV